MADLIGDADEAWKKEKGGESDKSFEQLEREFQDVLQDLLGDKTLDRFRIEYEKLHRALKKSHESEKRLMKKCRELNSEIVSNAAKVQSALKLSEEDQHTILALKKEIEKAWKMVDTSHEKEAKAKENIQQLKTEIASLSRLVEQGSGMNMGQESTLNELLRQKEELMREKENQMSQLMSLREEATQASERCRIAEHEKASMEQELSKLRDSIAAKKAEGERELKKKDRLEKELKELKQSLEVKQQEIKEKQTAVTQGQEQVSKLEHMLREHKAANDKLQKDYEMLNQKVVKLHQDLEEQIHTNTQLLADNSQRHVELKVKEEEITSIKAEAARVNKLRENTISKIKVLEKQKLEVEKQRDDLKQEVSTLDREVDAQRRMLELERKKQEELMREKDILNKVKTQAEHAAQKHLDLIRINEGTAKNLEQEIQGYKAEAQKQARVIFHLEKEREKYGTEASEATNKYMQALEEVKMREMTIIELQKKIVEAESKMKQQQTLYEAVRGDRNLYSKNLIESQDEIGEMKRKFKIMNHQIQQLKEEIATKDLALVKEHFDHMKVEKEKEALRFEMNKAQQQINEAESAIASQKAEIEKLNHIINEADQEQLRQKKEYDMVINERDILGTQLIRRNDELALLYEKIKIQQSTLNKGQIQYRDRVNEIRVLKIKLADLKRELSILINSVQNIDVLKREVHHLGRELLQERTKVKALSEELENPLNVHRWRKLEGSDPTSYEMIQKIQTLQKRLIAKTEEVVEKDMLIQEKEKLYVELKNILARQPGPEVMEQLAVYQQHLREKTRQMKAMVSELNMYQVQVNEYKYEIERLTRDLDEMKRKYYDQKRRDQVERDRKRAESQHLGGLTTVKPVLPLLAARFTGGGFNVDVHAGSKAKQYVEPVDAERAPGAEGENLLKSASTVARYAPAGEITVSS